MIKLFGKEIPSKMDELTLEQFQKISAIHNNEEYDTLEKHCKVFEYLGITEEEMDVDFDLFLANVKEFNNNNYDKKDPIKEIEIDGYTYKAEMKLSVKDSRIVEKIVKKDNKEYISDIMALMFKRTDLSNTEHYDPAHLKHKAKLFSKLKADISIPYLTFVTYKITNHAESQATKELESDISESVPGDQEAEQ
ncbi:hypothetical protein EBS67_14465 [bacterium]|nr:hypothetical protein [bacterium]